MARNKATRLPDYTTIDLKIPESGQQNCQFVFNPKGVAQREAMELWKRSKIQAFLGSAGCGKSFLALALAVQDALQGKCRKLMLARPLIENGREIGFFPGELVEKLGPWLAPFRDVAECCIGGKNAWESLQKLLEKAGCELELCAVEMLQGRNVRNGILIVDECQNLTWSQCICVLTRICEGSKIVLCGDPKQRNLQGDAPILEAMARLDRLDTVSTYCFRPEHVVRDPIVSDVIRLLVD